MKAAPWEISQRTTVTPFCKKKTAKERAAERKEAYYTAYEVCRADGAVTVAAYCPGVGETVRINCPHYMVEPQKRGNES